MSTNDPGIQVALAEIKADLADIKSKIAPPNLATALQEKVAQHDTELKVLRQRMQALENADHAPHAKG